MSDDEPPVFRKLCLVVRAGYEQFPPRCCVEVGSDGKHDGDHRGGRSVHFDATTWNDEKEGG